MRYRVFGKRSGEFGEDYRDGPLDEQGRFKCYNKCLMDNETTTFTEEEAQRFISSMSEEFPDVTYTMEEMK